MNYYFAPLHGITDYIYRNIVWKHFPYWDKFYAPFIQPNEKPVIVPKEYKEICTENNCGIPTVPQVLTCDAAGFIRVGEILEDCGYHEINLNLGCPVKVIISKGKGSGMLKDLNALDRFFDEIFRHNWNCKITVKTRLGFDEEDDFEKLLKVYSRYPIKELIIHPRFRSDYYNGMPRLEEFCKACTLVNRQDSTALGETHHITNDMVPFKICYNGNINTIGDVGEILKSFPCISSIMIGRGGLANPGLIRELKSGAPISIEEFKTFHDDILGAYSSTMAREENVVNKMMQMWSYWGKYFEMDRLLFDKLIHSDSIEKYSSTMKIIYETLQHSARK